ncbi:MAG: hypothetical protein JW959_12595, partial [Pirellulales bacterium]|nr:hypothetical protein [Pirellulales bacterium]
MSTGQLQLEEVGRLTGLLLEGALDAEDRRRLEETLLADPAALQYYQNYVDIHSLLHWQYGLSEACGAKDLIQQDSEVSAPPTLFPLPSPLSSSFVGGPVFSYMVASVVLCLMLLGAW